MKKLTSEEIWARTTPISTNDNIYKALASSPDGLTMHAIQEASGGHSTTVYRHVLKLMASGDVVVANDNRKFPRYRLSGFAVKLGSDDAK